MQNGSLAENEQGIPKRAGFTGKQLEEMHAILRTAWSGQRETRDAIKTYTIDNVPKEIPSDRDDGIFVEEKDDGGYRVYVTIADVAALVPLESELSQAAWKRAFTIYRPEWNDTMFPQSLEDFLSLEHKKPRLGLTVAIDLDDNFQPTHTEFKRVRCLPLSCNYEQAHDLIASEGHGVFEDPDGEHHKAFQLMDKVGKGLRKNHFKSNLDNMLTTAEEFVYPLQNNQDGALSPADVKKMMRQMDTQRLVETYMLLANQAVATHFSKSGLPFLYRNFDGTHISPIGTERAYYSPKLTKHTALEEMGLKGAYCHFTSPIRRGPDFFNAHMVHHVIDALEAVEGIVKELYPDIDQTTLKSELWNVSDQLLAAVKRQDTQAAIKEIKTAIEASGGKADDKITEFASHVAPWVTQYSKLPIDTPTLESHCERINTLNDHEAALYDENSLKRARNRQQYLLTRYNAMQAAADYPIHRLLGETNDDFSVRINDAVETGILPDNIYQAALERIASGKCNITEDALNIMVRGQFPEEEKWVNLKKAVAKVIKHQPGIVNSVLEMAHNRGFLPIDEFSIAEVSYPVDPSKPLPSEGEHINAALVAMNRDGAVVAPPQFSIGHDVRSALSHAKYFFLEHFAFGQLQPVEQSSIPNLLYAELNNPAKGKEEVLREMLSEIGVENPVINRRKVGARFFHTEIRVEGGALQEPITVTALTTSQQESDEAAIRRLLRLPQFKNAVTYQSALELHQVVNPRSQLEKRIEATGEKGKPETCWKMDVRVFENPKSSKLPMYHSKVSLHTDSGLREYEADGPNRHRAVNSACVKALQGEGWLSEQENGAKLSDTVPLERVASWTLDDQGVLAANAVQQEAAR